MIDCGRVAENLPRDGLLAFGSGCRLLQYRRSIQSSSVAACSEQRGPSHDDSGSIQALSVLHIACQPFWVASSLSSRSLQKAIRCDRNHELPS